MLPRTTRALLRLLDRSEPGPALDIGSHEGAVARAVGCRYVHVDLTACEAARRAGAPEPLHTDLLPEGGFRTIYFDARTYEPGLTLETIAQAAQRLSSDGVLITTARRPDIQPFFTEMEEAGEAYVARCPLRSGPLPAWPTFEVAFGGTTYRIQSAPGVFSPRKPDEGTLLMLAQIEAAPGQHFLDLGCGTGIVSKIASEGWNCPVTAVDISARALRVTALNAPRAEVIASDGFAGLNGRRFDIVASNPPYHTDFAVAKAFIEGAFAHLEQGGRLYLVVKRAEWYVTKVRHVFGGCRTVADKGYTVIVAEKREKRPPNPLMQTTPTTRKHAKRVALSARKRHR